VDVDEHELMDKCKWMPLTILLGVMFALI
jgi:hypothetical protein